MIFLYENYLFANAICSCDFHFSSKRKKEISFHRLKSIDWFFKNEGLPYLPKEVTMRFHFASEINEYQTKRSTRPTHNLWYTVVLDQDPITFDFATFHARHFSNRVSPPVYTSTRAATTWDKTSRARFWLYTFQCLGFRWSLMTQQLEYPKTIGD